MLIFILETSPKTLNQNPMKYDIRDHLESVLRSWISARNHRALLHKQGILGRKSIKHTSCENKLAACRDRRVHETCECQRWFTVWSFKEI